MKRNKRRVLGPRNAAVSAASYCLPATQPPSTLPAPSAPSPPPWRRVLYAHQPYADNHSPVEWLSALSSSYSSSPAESEYLPYPSLVWLTLIMANRASMLTLFVTAFYAINQRTLSTRSLLLLNVAVAAVLLAVHYGLSDATSSTSSAATSSSSAPAPPQHLSLASVCLLCFLLLLVSPLLSTLTWSYSSDTIYLLVLLLSAAHLLSFDYTSINSPTAPLTLSLSSTTAKALRSLTGRGADKLLAASIANAALPETQPASHEDADTYTESDSASSLTPLHHPVSLNCALLLSLLLASRLSSPLHVSLLLLLSSLLFAVSPSQQQLLRRWSDTAHLLSFALLSLLCCAALCWYCSALLAVLYAMSVLGVCLVCPWWLLHVQRYKRTIHGPWDYNDEPETSSAENL